MCAKCLFVRFLLFSVAATAQPAAPLRVASYAVRYRDAELLRPSQSWLAGADLSQGLRVTKAGETTKVTDSYELQMDKRSQCRYQANRCVFRFAGRR